MAEQNLRRSVMISHGDLMIFVTRPISLIFLLLTVTIIVTSQRKAQKMKKRQAQANIKKED